MCYQSENIHSTRNTQHTFLPTIIEFENYECNLRYMRLIFAAIEYQNDDDDDGSKIDIKLMSIHNFLRMSQEKYFHCFVIVVVSME